MLLLREPLGIVARGFCQDYNYRYMQTTKIMNYYVNHDSFLLYNKLPL